MHIYTIIFASCLAWCVGEARDVGSSPTTYVAARYLLVKR